MVSLAMGWRKPDNVAGSSAPAIMVGFFVATGGLLFGYDTGSINGVVAMSAFRRQFGSDKQAENPGPLSSNDLAIIIAILSVGTVVGAILSAPAADLRGRRVSLLFSIAVFIFGVIFQICASTIPILLVGRFFAGVAIGAVSVLVPLYQSEMAPKWIRGTLVCAYQLCITIGLLSASVVNLLTYQMDGAAAYRIPIGLQVVWACVLALGLLILPETPRYLIKRGFTDAAAMSLSRLRRLDITHPALMDELAEIQANHEYELALGPDTYMEMFTGSPHLGRRTLTGSILQSLQQLTGINFIMYYGTSFFSQAGIGNAFYVLLIVNVVNVVSTVPGLFIVETWGRRKLLMMGSIGMAVCQLLIASFTAAAPKEMAHTSVIILIVFVAVFIFFFALSWGPVTWVVTSEMYPLKVRARSIALTTSANWVLNFAVGYSTPYLVDESQGSAALGSRVFFIWGAFCILSIFFVYFMIYETSRLSLEQIDEMYERVSKAWQSPSFEPSWSFQQIRDLGYADSGIPPVEVHDAPHVQHHELALTTSHSDTNTDVTGPASASGDKAVPAMANVDFTY